jgi:hypothetical protein
MIYSDQITKLSRIDDKNLTSLLQALRRLMDFPHRKMSFASSLRNNGTLSSTLPVPSE